MNSNLFITITLFFLFLFVICLILYIKSIETSYYEKDEYLVTPKEVTVNEWEDLQKVYPAMLKADYTQQIPFHILQTNFSYSVPGRLKELLQYVQAMNGEYEIRYFNDTSAREFLVKHHPTKVVEAYDAIYPGAYKSDLFRAAYLCIYGGIYLDMGLIPLVPFRNLFKSKTKFMSCKDYDTYGEYGPYMYNAIMACTPQHPIMIAYLDRVVDNITKRSYEEGALCITGPGALGRAFKNVTGITVDKSGYYPQNILMLEHIIRNKQTSKSKCTLMFKEVNVFYTKYIEYHSDQNKIHSFNHKEHYGALFNKRQIYGEALPKNHKQITPEELSQNVNKQDNKQLKLKFYRDITIYDKIALKKFTTLNNKRQSIYYNFDDKISKEKQQLNLYYLQIMNSELNFIYKDNAKNQATYVDLCYFFLYPLRYYDAHIVNNYLNTIYCRENVDSTNISEQKYQIVGL